MAAGLPHFLRLAQGISRSGEPACVAYVGVAEGLTYLAPFVQERLFARHTATLAQIAGHEAQATAQRCPADLVVLVSPPEMLAGLRSARDIAAVPRIHQVVDTCAELASVQRHMSAREIKRWGAAKAAGFRYDITHEDRHFFAFYDGMHRPTMQARYGDQARSVERGLAHESLFRHGMLLRVFRGDAWVAGSTGQIDARQRTLNARLIGVAAGDPALRAAGAQNFVYHSLLDWACSTEGIDRVDFQGCEPFLTKGTFQYKKRFGSRAVIPDNVFGTLRMVLRVNRLTRSVRDFLVDNPVLDADGCGGLTAKYFHDRQRPLRRDIPCISAGITGIVAVDLDALGMDAEERA